MRLWPLPRRVGTPLFARLLSFFCGPTPGSSQWRQCRCAAWEEVGLSRDEVEVAERVGRCHAGVECGRQLFPSPSSARETWRRRAAERKGGDGGRRGGERRDVEEVWCRGNARTGDVAQDDAAGQGCRTPRLSFPWPRRSGCAFNGWLQRGWLIE